MDAERLRDFGHVNMGLESWVHAARTILAQGETLEAQAYDRLLASADYHSGRVLEHLQTGIFPAPEPVNGTGGDSRFTAYQGLRALFKTETPQNVLDMLVNL